MKKSKQESGKLLVDSALNQLGRDVYPQNRSNRRTPALLRQRLNREQTSRSRRWSWRVFGFATVFFGTVAYAGGELGWLGGWKLSAEVDGQGISLSGDQVEIDKQKDRVSFTINELDGNAPEGAYIELEAESAEPESARGSDSKARLRIDPFLISWANVAWGMIAGPDNPFWEGWDASDTPILIYLPGIQDVLLNHPSPPADFTLFNGEPSFATADMYLRSGPTLIDWDGQNTSREVFGVQTLVVADTLSTHKNALRGYLNDERAPEAILAGIDYEKDLLVDPYDQLATIIHEAFHVHQDRMAPNKGANELNARLYPCLSVENNVGFALEAEALAGFLRTEDDKLAREAAIRWLAVRLDRRASLLPEAIDYEDGNEFAEGLAMYTEWLLPQILQRHEPPAELMWSQGFRGFDDLDQENKDLAEQMRLNLRGEINVNNDPYGTSPVRGRLYFSGMAISAVLDRFSTDWRKRIFEADTTLTGLAFEALNPLDGELKHALRAARSAPGFAQLTKDKERLAIAGKQDTQRMLDDIVKGNGTSVVFDYSGIPDRISSLAFTAFGVRAVDEERCIYTLVPIQAKVGNAGHRFAQSIPMPTLDDRASRLFQFALTKKLDTKALGALLGEPHVSSSRESRWILPDLNVVLDGVQIAAPRAEITHDGERIVVRCLPTE